MKKERGNKLLATCKQLVYHVFHSFEVLSCNFFIVVFDDGDEVSLRRSSLCLQGARHFKESQVQTLHTHSMYCLSTLQCPALKAYKNMCYNLRII